MLNEVLYTETGIINHLNENKYPVDWPETGGKWDMVFLQANAAHECRVATVQKGEA